VARRPVTRARGFKRRQRVEWGFSKNTDFKSLGTNDVNLQRASVNFQNAIEEMTSPTLIRCRGDLVVRTVGGTVTNSGLVAAGIAVVSVRAADAGSTAVPRPVDEGEFSWLWHKFMYMQHLSNADTLAPVVSVIRIEVDSRAMRKILSKEEEVVFIIQSDALQGTITYEFAINIRFLLKEV